MRVVLATGDEQLNRTLAEAAASAGVDLEIVAEVLYREALAGEPLLRAGAEVAVVSTRLPGTAPLSSMLLPLRAAGVRVVVVGPPLPRQEAEELILLGVYDLLTGEQPIARIVQGLKTPATLGDALKVVHGEPAAVERSRTRVLDLLRQFMGTRGQAGVEPARAGERRSTPVGVGGAAPEEAAVEAKPARRPVVAVWSPAAAGKTSVAVELAAALGLGGVPVLILDTQHLTRDVLGRVCAGRGEWKEGIDGPYTVWDNVWCASVQDSAVERALASSAPEADWCVVDCRTDLSRVVDRADVVLYVADPDWTRADIYRKKYRELGRNGKVLVPCINRWVETDRARPEDVLQAQPAAVFPLSIAAYTAMLAGKPAQDLDPGVRAAAHALALAVAKAMAARQS